MECRRKQKDWKENKIRNIEIKKNRGNCVYLHPRISCSRRSIFTVAYHSFEVLKIISRAVEMPRDISMSPCSPCLACQFHIPGWSLRFVADTRSISVTGFEKFYGLDFLPCELNEGPIQFLGCLVYGIHCLAYRVSESPAVDIRRRACNNSGLLRLSMRECLKRHVVVALLSYYLLRPREEIIDQVNVVHQASDAW